MSKKYFANISFLRIAATISVVFLHTCCTLSLNPETFDFSKSQEIFFQTGHQLFLWAVPVFFMISGMLLLSSEKEMTYKAVLKKYVLRLALALILFGVMFGAVKSFVEFHTIKPLYIMKWIIENDTFSHLWYLYTLISVYLILPLLYSGVKHMSDKDLLILLSLCFLFSFFAPTVQDITGMRIEFSISVSYAVFYFILGYYLKRTPVRRIFKGNINILIIILCVAAIIALIITDNYNNISNIYTSPLIAVYSIAVFCLALDRKEEISENKFKKIWKIDRLCFGVYLIHPLFIQLTYRFIKITPLSFNNYILMTFVFAIVFTVISFLASFIMNLIPFVKKYIL